MLVNSLAHPDHVSVELARLCISRNSTAGGSVKVKGTREKVQQANTSLQASSPPSAISLLPVRGWSTERMNFTHELVNDAPDDKVLNSHNRESNGPSALVGTFCPDWPRLADLLESTHCLRHPGIGSDGSSFADHPSDAEDNSATVPDTEETDGPVRYPERPRLAIPSVVFHSHLPPSTPAPFSSTSAPSPRRCTHSRQPSLCQQDFAALPASSPSPRPPPVPPSPLATSVRDLNLILEASRHARARRLNITRLDNGEGKAKQHCRRPSRKELNLLLRASHHSVNRRLLARRQLIQDMQARAQAKERPPQGTGKSNLEEDFIAVASEMRNKRRLSTEVHPRVLASRRNSLPRLHSHRPSMSLMRRMSSSAVADNKPRQLRRGRRSRITSFLHRVVQRTWQRVQWSSVQGCWSRLVGRRIAKATQQLLAEDQNDHLDDSDVENYQDMANRSPYELVQKYLRMSKETAI